MRRILVSAGLTALILFATDTRRADAATIAPRVAESIREKVIPAYVDGEPWIVLSNLSPLVLKLKDPQLEAIDRFLEKEGLPSVAEMLAESRFAMIRQRHVRDLPKPSQRELLLVIPAIVAQIESTLREVSELPIMHDPLPSPNNLSEYEEIFWSVHVFENQLATAEVLATYGAELAKLASKTNLKSLDENQRRLLDFDDESIAGSIQASSRELGERKTEMRLNRLAFAADVIAESNDLKDRFRAAFVTDIDSYWLLGIFRSSRAASFLRPRLNDPNLLTSIETYQRIVSESDGDLIEKSRLLFTGLHWWTRGRYGRGPDGFGLLKSVFALSSPQAQFALFMPIATPQPTDPMTNSDPGVPEFDRRHHYIWTYEYRQARQDYASSSQSRMKGKMESKPASITRFNTFY